MALATYSDLLAAIQNYEEDTSSIVTNRQDEWVTLAEQRINFGSGKAGMSMYSPPLRVRHMEATTIIPVQQNQDGGTSGGSADAQTVTLATVPTLARGLTISFTAGFSNAGAATLNANALGAVAIRKGVNQDSLESGDLVAGGEYAVYHDGTFFLLMPSAGGIPLPPRYLGMKTIYLQTNQARPLDFKAPQQFVGMEAVNSSGVPSAYTIDGDSLRLAPPPDGAYFLVTTYWRRFQPLATAVNELFRQAPSIWLYGALLEGALYLGEDENVIKWHGNFMSACQGVVNSDQRDRYGSAPLTMSVAGPTP